MEMNSEGNKIFVINPNLYIIYAMSIGTIILLISYLFEENGIGITTLIIMLSAIILYLYEVLMNRVTSIEINLAENILKINWANLNKKKQEIYLLHEIEGNFTTKVGARGGKMHVFQLTKGDKVVLDLMSTYNGFSQSQLEEISVILKEDPKNLTDSAPAKHLKTKSPKSFD